MVFFYWFYNDSDLGAHTGGTLGSTLRKQGVANVHHEVYMRTETLRLMP